MAKMSVLDMVQNILSAMEEDEVNSIGDTITSELVAQELRTTYYENLNLLEVPYNQQIVRFDALQEPEDHPNVLLVPDNIVDYEWIKYNVATVDAPDYREVCYLEPLDFFEKILTTNTSGIRLNVKTIGSDLNHTIQGDKHPQWYTVLEDRYIVFDSINNDIDDTIQNSKCMAFAQVIPEFKLEDSFVPVLRPDHFPMLLAETKSAAWINQKGVSNSKEEQRSRRQRVRHIRHRHRYAKKPINSETDFGRS